LKLLTKQFNFNKMKTEKMSFKNIKDVLSRDEMKGIMAGSGSGIVCVYSVGPVVTGGACSGSSVAQCTDYCNDAGYSGCFCI